MIPQELQELIQGGEGITVEFKKSRTEITKDVYETVCAFSNRDGGHIFLGIKDDGTILGIEKDKVDKVKKDFVTAINNENKIYPPLYLSPVEYEDDGKYILYIRVPVAQDVCRCNGRIFDRNHEADIDITHHSDEVYRLYARKSGSYYVNKVFTAFNIADLRSDLIERARSMTRVRAKDHPWMDMTNEEVVRSAGLVLRDQSSGKEGITLAAILLFGTDQLIMSVLPQHKTDAIFRVFNTDRYDDRDVVLTNLLESYDRLMAFGKKHLNDTFHLDGIQSVSARDNILREIVSNLLAHRDFSNAYVAKLIIEKNCIYTENANLSHGHGVLNLATFEPFSKNPPISKVFREIGLADELGSGMRNTYKYTKMYSGGEPQFIEGDVFRITIPLSEAASVTVGPELSDVINGTRNETRNGTRNETKNGTRKLSKTEENILAEIRKNPYVTKREICELLGVGKSTVARATKKLKDHGIIVRVGSTKAGYWKY
ncbi:MAG: winged helix-turn-helix transcriptional regulator [Lachnospiraceae bacterium]|nr:winged helix-turn-helix transcriptional regulator [Lachnospiraceae bacterium]